jgi:hypothetical protein
MLRIALTSYLPPGPPIWPDAGRAEWETVVGNLTETNEIRIQTLPCHHTKDLHWQSHAHWVVLELDSSEFAEEGGSVKFSSGKVLFNGSPRDAHAYLHSRGLPAPFSLEPLIVGRDWENITLGEYGIAIAGQDAGAAVGDSGIAYATTGLAVAGNSGAAISTFGDVTAGDFGCAWTRDGRTAKAGHRGVAWTYEFGNSEARGCGVAITDDCGSAVAGEYGFAISGCSGTSTSGNCGVAFAREGGKVMAGEAGILLLRWGDEIKVARVGEGGIKPNAYYCLDSDGLFVECMPPSDDNYEGAPVVLA